MPNRVCSGFYAADVFMRLDGLFNDKLLLPVEPSDKKKTLAIHEGGKMKKLMGGLRYLWRSSRST